MRFHSSKHAYGCCAPCTCGATQAYGRVEHLLPPLPENRPPRDAPPRSFVPVYVAIGVLGLVLLSAQGR